MGVHLSGVVAGIAAIPAIAAFAFRRFLPIPAAIALWHIAGTGLVVSIAASGPLARHTTWIMGKRKNGTISPLAFTALWPYHVGLRAKLAIQRKVSTEPSWDAMGDNYYLGAWPSEEALVPTVHPAVLDVTCELPLQIKPPAYLNLPVWDTHGPDLDQIDQGVAWSLEQERAGRPVLIHCAHGHGRSATVLAAVLIAKGKAGSVAEAERVLKASRPRVRLNTRQRAVLTKWVETRKKSK